MNDGGAGTDAEDDEMAEPEGEEPSAGGPAGPAATREEVAALHEDVQSLREDLESRTVHRDQVEADLRGYVRSRLRRGHARGWGPYLVLLYGTVMTLGAFYFLSGGWAILAMLVVWLSTLGLYVVMLVFGVIVAAGGFPRRALGAVRDWRS